MADEQAPQQKQLVMQKVYIKDLSFESPRTPAVFSSNASPQTQLNLKTKSTEVAPNTQEVVLTVTVETKDQEQTLFLIEVVQAGVFRLEGYTPEESDMILGGYCPGALYPFAREAIADIVTKGGFPQLLLQPINFDALYAQSQAEAKARGEQGGPAISADGSVTATPPGSGETH